MKIAAFLFISWVFVGGCAPLPPSNPPIPPEPPEQPTTTQRIEGYFLVAERTIPKEITVGNVFTVTLTVTAKRSLEYVFWREIIGGYAMEEVSTDEDLEFMVLRVPQGATITWQYRLWARQAGEDRIDGVIKAVAGPYSEDLRLKGAVEVGSWQGR